jgi:alkylhydroperoxidase family enzyme
MRLNAPRIAPVPEDQWTAEQKELAAPMNERGKMFNIFRTLLAHPDAMRGFLSYGNYILSKRNTLPAREREIVILRTGYLCRSGYEWAQHVEIRCRDRRPQAGRRSRRLEDRCRPRADPRHR